MECPFVFSFLAEIPAFCPGDQCLCTCFPLRLSPLRGPPAETSIAWRFSEYSRKMTPLTLVCHKTPAATLLCPLSLSLSFACPYLCLVLFYLFIFLFIYFSFILSHYPHVRQNNVLVVATNRPRLADRGRALRQEG